MKNCSRIILVIISTLMLGCSNGTDNGIPTGKKFEEMITATLKWHKTDSQDGLYYSNYQTGIYSNEEYEDKKMETKIKIYPTKKQVKLSLHKYGSRASSIEGWTTVTVDNGENVISFVNAKVIENTTTVMIDGEDYYRLLKFFNNKNFATILVRNDNFEGIFQLDVRDFRF